MPEPKPAVVCIVQRDDGAVLLGRRNPSLRFMGGHYVFPGGRIDADEGVAHVEGAASANEACAVHAAVREVFEETGLLLTEGSVPPAADLRVAREAVLADPRAFDGVLERFSQTIYARAFTPAGAWVTPESSPIRFDTCYFLHRLRHDRDPELIEGEMVAVGWFQPAEARRLWHVGEIELSPPVAYTLHHLAALPQSDCLAILTRSTGRVRGIPKRLELCRGIHVVPLVTRTIPPATHTNCIVVGEAELIVIDPGAEDAEELAYLQVQLDHLIELGGAIKAVVLTHSHRDHVDGVGFVRERYGAPVWAHAATDDQVKFTVDRTIEDGEALVLAGDPEWRLRAVHTPGHDPGHLSFVEESTRTLLCGDMIANPGSIVVSREYGGDMNQFLASLEKLIALDCNLVIPSHGVAAANPAEKLREHLEHRLWREKKIEQALQEGCTGMGELLERAYDDVPKAALPLAEHALKAHLARLGVEVGE